LKNLLDLLEKQPSYTRCVQIDRDTNVCELRTEVAPGIGISIVGEMDDEGKFEREFYFPYLTSKIKGSTAECTIQRHAERETYAGMVDENRVGISLIFYVQNFLDYRERRIKKDQSFKVSAVNFAGLSVSGKFFTDKENKETDPNGKSCSQRQKITTDRSC